MPLLQAFLRRYARAEATAVAPFVVGRRVLDLGAGEGYVGSVLGNALSASGDGPCASAGERLGLRVRRRALSPRPPDRTSSTTASGYRFARPRVRHHLLLLALHHCTDPERVLDEARPRHPPPAHRDRVGRPPSPRPVLARSPRPAPQRAPPRRRHERSPRLPDVRRVAQLCSPPAASGCSERDWLGPWWERLVHHPVMFVLRRPTTPPRRGRRPRRSGSWRREASSR